MLMVPHMQIVRVQTKILLLLHLVCTKFLGVVLIRVHQVNLRLFLLPIQHPSVRIVKLARTSQQQVPALPNVFHVKLANTAVVRLHYLLVLFAQQVRIQVQWVLRPLILVKHVWLANIQILSVQLLHHNVRTVLLARHLLLVLFNVMIVRQENIPF